MAALRRKLTVVGDDSCGKTCLLFALRHEQLPKCYEPTVFDTYATDIEVDGKDVKLILFDVAGKDEASYQNLRSVSYQDTDIILMCFSVDRPDSLQNILDIWVPEIKLFCSTVPIILVATKIELRDDEGVKQKLATPGKEPISTAKGKALAASIGAYAYLECSAKTKEGVDTALEIISQCLLSEKRRRRKRHHRSCRIL
ncbi:rho-related GTP-binding protein RhoB-like [Apteryx mantelli]|uniref:Rho-related GTP-binding protein RhoB-like n=1 Tax=Apteryx mantelli TaxID=2696672 RepID=A0A8B7ISM5_9AVES|nr:PREDICTED: rho-related GTP-binding protein RhoB-like [Apteryx mantelli mantelli]XP_025922494.1 rho-related GTP-binding protein RhoB-like [Apteryx rowi]